MKSRHALIFVFITALLDSVGFGIIMPVLPQLVMDVTGEGLSSAARYGGWLMFAYAGMQFFLAPIIGFAFFTAINAPVYFPGAPFVVAAVLTVFALSVFLRATAGLEDSIETASG